MFEAIQIKLATTRDAGQIAAMSRDLIETGLGWSWTRPRVIRHIQSPDSVVLVAQRHRQVVAFAIMRFGEEEAHLDLLAVRTPYRRSGVGRRLIEWLEKSALVAGVSVVYLEVRESNDPAQLFYQRLGFCKVMRMPGYYRGQEAAIGMAKDLWSSSIDAKGPVDAQLAQAEGIISRLLGLPALEPRSSL